MFRTLALVVLAIIFLPRISQAELTIHKLSYDSKQDLLVIDTSYPGKCLEHEFSLDLQKKEGKSFRFHLKLSNGDGQDPCNGIVNKSPTFSMAEIKRPAEILVSAAEDGNKPRLLILPVHIQVDIIHAQLINGLLEVSLKTEGPITPDRFYLSLDPRCENQASCEAYVHDKKSNDASPKEKSKIKKVKLSVNDFRGTSLRLKTVNNKIISIYVP